ncbi:hypothetical protein PHLGIDRAFT_157855 [Phlebiopsis gigantea 11061_1 CR5-6]|uniref:Uncharacterized protein n=1 Tax=Phlebiopsis gigantea (strain 11061_1 CR5-6) TaxID=745531 RepID=A0A0C3P0A1_PHLG1|nr:hypothetical protein PHLGIDRAFT_157855 [Phlebiopsis gigantea 11061_1 CR5-6]
MAGANYMGGRRNAAKARVRDTDGRLQRSHFSKQRFPVLAKGLARNLVPPDRTSAHHEAILVATIPFAHARKAPEMMYGQEHAEAMAKSPAYTRQFTPRRHTDRQKPRVAPSSASSRSSRSSNILHELDMSEHLPDFAGLSQTSSLKRKYSTDSSKVAICEDAAYSEFDPNLGTSPARSSFFMESGSAHRSREVSTDEPSAVSDRSPMCSFIPCLSCLFAHFYISATSGSDFEAMSFEDDDVLPYNLNVDSGYIENTCAHIDDTLDDVCLQGADARGEGFDTGLDEALRRPTWNRMDFVTNSAAIPHDSVEDSSPDKSSEHVSGHSNLEPSTTRLPLEIPPYCGSYSPGFLSASGSSSSLPKPVRMTYRRGTPSAPQFLSDVGSSSRYRRSTDICMQESLLDIVKGKLFEDADPWTILQHRLGVDSSACSGLQPARFTLELCAAAIDRRGVGYCGHQHLDQKVRAHTARSPLHISLPITHATTSEGTPDRLHTCRSSPVTNIILDPSVSTARLETAFSQHEQSEYHAPPPSPTHPLTAEHASCAPIAAGQHNHHQPQMLRTAATLRKLSPPVGITPSSLNILATPGSVSDALAIASPSPDTRFDDVADPGENAVGVVRTSAELKGVELIAGPSLFADEEAEEE